MFKDFIVSNTDQGLRLDQFLTRQLKGQFSRSYLQQVIDQGKVLVNQKKVKRHEPVREGDRIEIELEERERPWLVPENIPLEILYEDEDLLVVNKPAGMVVHPAYGNYSGTLVHALLAHSPTLSEAPDPTRPGIVHRLDKETSGLLVVAKNNFAHAQLAKQFLARTVKKKYLAIVKGRVAQEEGLIELPVGRHPFHRQKMSVTFGRTRSREAQTSYRVLKRFKETTYLEVEPTTGRTHQIRVHLASIGHPVLGDQVYGSRHIPTQSVGMRRPTVSHALRGTQTEPSLFFKRQALHAASLSFIHPRTGRTMALEAPLPKDMEELFKKLACF